MKITYKQVNYKYIYNNTLRFIFLRKYKKNFFDFFKLKIFLWFRRMEFETMSLLKLYDNLVYFFFLFNARPLIYKVGSTLKRGIYYYRLIFSFNILRKKFLFEFLDIFLNLILQNTRKDTIFYYNFNNDLLYRIGDTSYFSNTKIGNFYYIEHMNDIIYLHYSFKYLNIKNYLNVFKFYF